ncbi:hypothetical protein [Vagococcus sp.]|uniref:hypothetical protein n=1 Tax=Vagococcus sp. TaxID=1933889 RepID=UPI002FCA9D80
MSLRLLGFELKKLLEQPMIIIFLGLCWVFNLVFFISINVEQTYLSTVGIIRETKGDKIDHELKEMVINLPKNKRNQRLINDVTRVENIYTNNLEKKITEDIQREFQITEPLMNQLEKKYRDFQPMIKKLSKEKAAFDLAGASETSPYFEAIRFFLLRFVLVESLIFSLLIGLYSSTSEKATKTSYVTLTTKTGRGVQVSKYLSGLILSSFFFILVTIVSFGVFFIFHPMSGFGNSSVSTWFNQNMYTFKYLDNGIVILPFMTWIPMSFNSYMLYSLGFSFILVFLFYSSQFLIGLWLDHLFKGVILTSTLIVIHKILVVGSVKLGTWHVFSWLMFSPIQVFETQPFWFTEMGPFTILPLQEVLVTGIAMILLVISAHYMKTYYQKKEVY